jgi:hypothetical protein
MGNPCHALVPSKKVVKLEIRSWHRDERSSIKSKSGSTQALAILSVFEGDIAVCGCIGSEKKVTEGGQRDVGETKRKKNLEFIKKTQMHPCASHV